MTRVELPTLYERKVLLKSQRIIKNMGRVGHGAGLRLARKGPCKRPSPGGNTQRVCLEREMIYRRRFGVMGRRGGGIVTRKGAVTKWIGNEKRFDEDKKMTADESS